MRCVWLSWPGLVCGPGGVVLQPSGAGVDGCCHAVLTLLPLLPRITHTGGVQAGRDARAP
jgi:hypothetical protein